MTVVKPVKMVEVGLSEAPVSVGAAWKVKLIKPAPTGQREGYVPKSKVTMDQRNLTLKLPSWIYDNFNAKKKTEDPLAKVVILNPTNNEEGFITEMRAVYKRWHN